MTAVQVVDIIHTRHEHKGDGMPEANDKVALAIGEAIHDQRIKLGMGAREVARKAGVSHSYLLRVEAGGSDVTIGMLRRLSDALGLDPVRLLKSAI